MIQTVFKLNNGQIDLYLLKSPICQTISLEVSRGASILVAAFVYFLSRKKGGSGPVFTVPKEGGALQRLP